MTQRQKFAYQHPCTRAFDTLNERFKMFTRKRGILWSTILTVNK